ncbi:hypothetical protein SLA2020_497080 [Shorea laevis]
MEEGVNRECAALKDTAEVTLRFVVSLLVGLLLVKKGVNDYHDRGLEQNLCTTAANRPVKRINKAKHIGRVRRVPHTH